MRLWVGAHAETSGSDRCSNWLPCQNPQHVREGPCRKQNPPNGSNEGTLMKKSLARYGKGQENWRPPKAGNRGEPLPALGGKEKGWEQCRNCNFLAPTNLGSCGPRKRMKPLPEKGQGTETLTSISHPPISSRCPSLFIQMSREPGGTVLGVRPPGHKAGQRRAEWLGEDGRGWGWWRITSPEGNCLNVLQVCLGTDSEPSLGFKQLTSGRKVLRTR